jgi:hypothetical protein
VACPACGPQTARVHEYRERTVADVPAGRPPGRGEGAGPPDVNAKTRQKHDYPSAAHRHSYARRTGAEQTRLRTAKDPATNNISRGWCRLMNLTPLMLFTTALLIVRNQRILDAWNARQEHNARRAAAGLPPKPRKRRRTNECQTLT